MEWILNFYTPSSLYCIFTRMNTSLVLAQFWGGLMSIVWILLIIRQERLLKPLLKLSHERLYTVLAGFMTLILGLVNIIIHNIWVNDWRVSITLIWWIALAKWVSLLGFPYLLSKKVSTLEKFPRMTQLILILCVFIGIYLFAQGLWLSLPESH